MGAKRPSIRTLPSGERVWHHPPDDAHPEGMMVLIRDHSPLKRRHDARLHHHRARHEEIKAIHGQRLHAKIADQRAKGVPPEKSPF